jgi:hypothetical protein
MQIAIPSVARAERLTTTATLPILEAGGVPLSSVTVFVPTADDRDVYRRLLPAEVSLVWGHGLGVGNARNAIARYYPAGTDLVEVDDDVTGVVRAVDSHTLVDLAPGELVGVLADCIARSGGRLWGWYPVANPYFMRHSMRTGLWYIIASLCGYRVTGGDHELVVLDDKEDFERSCRFYVAQGSVVRFERLAVRSRYYTEPGGMQLTRTPETIAAGARRLVELFPGLATYRERKNGVAEVRLRAPKGL